MKYRHKYRLIGLITALTFSLSSFTATAQIYDVDFTDSVNFENFTDFEDNETDEFASPFTYSPMFVLPENMRGTIISPEIDFFTSPDNSFNDVMLQLDDIMNEITSFGLNTVIIKTAVSENTYYNLDMNSSKNDIISAAVQKAQSSFLNVYLIYDITPVLEAASSKTDAVNSLISEAHRFAIKYPCDGIILDSYYAESSSSAFGEYMRNGSGIGYKNWLYDSTEYYFKTVSDIIRVTDNNIPVGIMINDVWANNSSLDGGSPTEDSIEAYFDGYADTKKYIEDGYADFAMVRAYGSLYDEKLPFTETSEWWGGLCASAGIPMYTIHYNEKIGTSYSGWGSEDQLLKQLTVSKDITAYKGSVFNSYFSLSANPLNTTTKIKQFFGDQINEDSLFSELKITSPTSLNFTTYEPYQDFSGSFDENFDVYFNGNRITPNEAGRFYFEEELSIGLNTFTIKHKDKTITYKIERKIITMREISSSIAEGKTLRVDGETSITVEAVAYKGAEVVATINGQTIKLKEKNTVSQDDVNSSYANFTGKYKVPAGIEEKEQNLGTVAVQASYLGYVKTLYGATVIVNAKPKPPEIIPEKQMFDQDSLGSGEVVGTIDPVRLESESAKLVHVNANNTHVLDAKDTGTVYTPEFNQLPAGTVDYFKADVGGFYTTDSGKRFFAKDVSLIDGTGIGENNLVVKSSGTYGGDSYFKINLDKRVSYQVEAAGLKYFSEWGGDYDITSFDTEYIYITFDNVTSVTKLPGFEANMVFSAGKWEQVTVGGIPKFRLVLKLRQTGVYMGSNAYYNSDGDLMLTFPVMQNSLSGMTIVIDPGHGYGNVNSSVFDPGAIGQVIEQEVILDITKLLAQKFKEQGVNTVRLETEKMHYLTVQRPIVARAYGCDIFISLHANKAPGKDEVRGTEVYYFTPFSKPLASAISSRVSSYFSKNVYADGADKNRGAKYLDFWVTLQQDFPSVLVETGFVGNMEDAMALANPEHQSGIADAIVKGVKDYLSRSSITYSTDGSAYIPEGDSQFTPEVTSVETTTTTATEEAEAPEVPDEESSTSDIVNTGIIDDDFSDYDEIEAEEDEDLDEIEIE